MSDSLIFRDDIERAGWFAIYASVLGPFLSDKSCVHVEENCEAWADDTVRTSRKRSPEQPRVDSLATVLASTSKSSGGIPTGSGWTVGDWYLTPKGYRGVVVHLLGNSELYGCEEPEWFRTEYGPGDACCAPLSELRRVEGPQGSAFAVAWDGSAANWKERALMARRAHEEIAANLAALVGAFGTLDSEISDLTEGPRVSVEIANDIEELFHTARGAVDAVKGDAPTAKPRTLPDPDNMHGAADGFGGEDPY